MILGETTHYKTTEPLTEIFSQLGRACSIPLIFALGERSYNIDVRELQESIDSSGGRKLNESTISRCLSDLVEIGLVEGTMRAHSAPVAEYCLTSTGQQIYRHLLQIRHLAERANNEETLLDSMSAC